MTDIVACPKYVKTESLVHIRYESYYDIPVDRQYDDVVDSLPSEPQCIFIICPVRQVDREWIRRLELYVSLLEEQGHTVHLPHRDTDQAGTSLDICSQNTKAIADADEVHVFYMGQSQGIHFDLGVAFALDKKIRVIENDPQPAGKSFPDLISTWADES